MDFSVVLSSGKLLITWNRLIRNEKYNPAIFVSDKIHLQDQGYPAAYSFHDIAGSGTYNCTIC
jgi:hypothetical protein